MPVLSGSLQCLFVAFPVADCMGSALRAIDEELFIDYLLKVPGVVDVVPVGAGVRAVVQGSRVPEVISRVIACVAAAFGRPARVHLMTVPE